MKQYIAFGVAIFAVGFAVGTQVKPPRFVRAERVSAGEETEGEGIHPTVITFNGDLPLNGDAPGVIPVVADRFSFTIMPSGTILAPEQERLGIVLDDDTPEQEMPGGSEETSGRETDISAGEGIDLTPDGNADDAFEVQPTEASAVESSLSD